jgi:hypothetical protein
MRKFEKGARLEAEGVAVESILNRNLANNTPVFHISFRIPHSDFPIPILCHLSSVPGSGLPRYSGV